MEILEAKRKIKNIVISAVFVTPLVIVPVSINSDYFYEPKLYILLLFAILFLLLLLNFRKNIDEIIQFDKINLSLFVYFLLLCVSIFFAIDKTIAIQGRIFRDEGLITLIIYMILFLAARIAKKFDSKNFNLILISAFIVSFYGILQYYRIDPIPRDYIRSTWGWPISFSTIGNPNFLSSYLVLMIPISVHSYIIEKNKFALLVFCTLYTCLLCTMTRGGWIGSFISICVYLFLIYKYRNKYPGIYKRVFQLLLLSVIIFYLFYHFSNNRLAVRIDSLTINSLKVASSVNSIRLFIWVRVLELIKMKPWFGYGIENLLTPFMSYFSSDIENLLKLNIVVDKAHNEYLNIAVSSGIPSLIAYLSFVSLCLKTGIIRLKENPIYLALFASVIGYLIQATFNISVVSVAYVFWIFLGLLVGDSAKKTKKLVISRDV